jgi:LPXTG-site transpeptidase (sortase) family protein
LKGKVRVIIGFFICVIGALIFLYPTFRELKTQSEVDGIISRFKETYEESENNKSSEKDAKDSEDQIVEDGLENASKDSSEKSSDRLYDGLYEEMFKYNSDLFINGQQLSDAFSYEYVPIDLASFDPNSAIGYIEIPSIGCSLPLFLGASEEHLSRGAAVMGNTSMPVGGENANCVIAGHRGYLGSAYFRNINQISEGDRIFITNPWETLVYEAVSMEVITPYDEDPLLIREGEDIVTIVSCHPYMIGGGPDRIVVQCRRVGSLSNSEPAENENAVYESTSVTDRADTEENSMGDDASTYFRISDTNDDETLMFAESLLRKILPAFLIFAAILILIKNRKNKTK